MSAPEKMSHEAAQELLPWLANGSLPDAEQARVEEHARTCVACRRSLDEIGVIADAVAADVRHVQVPSADMRSINRRLDRLEERRRSGRLFANALMRLFASPWRAAAVLQAVVIVALLGTLLRPQDRPTPYTTLTNPPTIAGGMAIRAVFSPELGHEEIGTLLERHGLTVVAGPSARGVYTLGRADGLTAVARDRIVQALQAEPGVLFAQPAVTGNAP